MLTHAKCASLKTLERRGELKLTRTQRAELLSISHIPCEACDGAALRALPIRSASAPPLQKDKWTMHVDLHGPLIPSKGGAVWILALRHAVSGLVVVTFPSDKGDSARAKLKEAILIMLRVYRVEAHYLRSDRGSEFVSQEMADWLLDLRVRHQPTEAESSRQNGMVECIWGILIPRAKAMLTTANMSKVYWADAVSYAAAVMNMLPSRTRQEKSPMEILTGRRPALNKIRPWGCLVLVKILRGDRRKGDLSTVVKRCVLLNFSGIDGYKCLHIATSKILHSRNVSFHPQVFPFTGQILPEDANFEADLEEEVPSRLHTEPPRPLSIRRSSRVTYDPNRYDPAAFTVNTAELRSYRQSWGLQPKSVGQALHEENPYRHQWAEAIDNEVRGLIDNSTYVIDDPQPDDICLWSMFVFASKTGCEGNVLSLKARLVANGKPQFDTDSFAPTPRWSTIRFFLKLIVDLSLFTQQVDVKQAYLLTDLPEKNVTIFKPRGYPFFVPHGKILRLRKCLYGLKQSGRHWNKNVHNFISMLKEYDFDRSKADPCFYIDKQRRIFIIVFVDDFIIAGRKNMVMHILSLFKMKYPIKELGELSWYLRCKIKRGKDSLHFSQKAFAEMILEEAGMVNCKAMPTPAIDFLYTDDKEVPVPKEKAARQRRIIGQLLYLCVATRPDLSFAVGQLCKHMAEPRPKVWTYTKRVLRYLKGTVDFGILYKRRINSQLEGYGDSDWAGDKVNRKSISGMAWMYGGDLISYKCKQQSTVADSSMHAELIAMTSAAKEGIYLRKLVEDIHAIPTTVLFTDNNATLLTAKDYRVTERNKHIEVKYFFVRELIDRGLIEGRDVDTKKNVSDMMTKPQGPTDFLRNRYALHIVECPRST